MSFTMAQQDAYNYTIKFGVDLRGNISIIKS
jgi:hypothetical protein